MSENVKQYDIITQQIIQLYKNNASGDIDKGLLAELKDQQAKWRWLIQEESRAEIVSMEFNQVDLDWIASVTGINWKYRLWTAISSELDETVVPSPGFREAFKNVTKAFHMPNEPGRRMILNLFLSDIILRPEFENALRIYPGIEMEVETNGPKKRRLYGKTDYAVGFGKNVDIFDSCQPRELHLIADAGMYATMEGEQIWQIVAETLALYKSKKDAGNPNCAVWGVFTNAQYWKFIHIDNDGKLWRSDELVLDLKSYDEAQILEVYRMLHYVVKCCYHSFTPKPPTSPEKEYKIAS